MLKRRLKLLGKILLALIALFVGFLLFERFRGQIALASYKKKLLAKGEKLSPQDFVTTFSEAENGAPAAIAAIGRLQAGKISTRSAPPKMRVLRSGRAIVGFEESEWVEAGNFRDGEWVEERTTNRWEQLSADLLTNNPVLAELCAALNQPVLNNQLDYAKGPNLKLPHLAKTKTAAQCLSAAIQVALREGRTQDASVNLRCQIQLPNLLAEDYTLISELVRVAVGGIAQADTWEALQGSDWNDSDLIACHSAWQDQHFAKAMTRCFERELMSVQITYERLRASNEETFRLLGLVSLFSTAFEDIESEDGKGWIGEKIPFYEELSEFVERQIYCRIWRFAWSHQAELSDLKIVYEALELIRQAAATASYNSIRDKIDSYRAATDDHNFYDRIRYLPLDLNGAYAKIIAKAIRAEINRSLTISAITLKRYSLHHGKFPASLDVLVPGFLTAVPVDYMDGKPIKYRLNADGSFTLYSVGEDGQDDGGDLTLPEGSKNKDLWRRRDYVWPAPATPEEVEEYRQNAGRN